MRVERLGRWSASRPGKHLSETSAGSLESDTGNPPPSGAAFQVRFDYAAAPARCPRCGSPVATGSAARVVDLAGKAFRSTRARPFTHASPEFTYARLEPLASRSSCRAGARAPPGESLETIGHPVQL